MPELLHTTRELESFRREWEELWREDANATPFQHPDWLLPWWRQFGKDGAARAAVVRRGGRTVAFLPFYIYTEPDSRKRRLLLIGASTTDYLDGIFAPDCRMEDLSAAIQSVHDCGGWDTINVTQIRANSLLAQALQFTGADRFAGERCWQMRAAPIDELPVKLRHNVMYYRNRAARCGTLEFRIADSFNWANYFDTLTRQHTEHWRERGSDGVLASPHVQAWHREGLPLLQKSGLLRLCALSLDGVPLGVAYGLADAVGRPARTEYIYLHTYSLEHAELRPGTLLLAFAMEQAASESIEFIDLLRGDEAYKRLWPSEPVQTLGFSVAAALARELLSA